MSRPFLAAFDPPLPPGAIVHLDADLVVIDKPWGISTHAASAERDDDALTRLRASLATADDPAPYLGTHHRLDRDTSGLLLFARRKEANVALAAQFEERKVDKGYLAIVEGDARAVDGRTLRDKIVEQSDGSVRAVPEGHREGKLAVTSVEVVRRVGKRTLLSAKPSTGRTHQIRVQLARAGVPIVGDVAYGGAPFARLLLHAERLGLRHPTSGARISFRAPAPEEMEAALVGAGDTLPASPATIARRIQAAASRRLAVARADTTAYRLVHGAGDLLPGVTVDALGDYAVVSLLVEMDRETEDAIFDAVFALGARGVYVKRRPKHASRIVDARRDDLAPPAPVRGEAAPEELEVRERGIPYLVRTGDGLSTGLFVDQRENRGRVASLARDRRLLNLFSYTAGFTVAAGISGAASSVSVDAARPATDWARRNLVNAELDPERHVLLDMDCFLYLKMAKKRGERFDVAVVDPPSFSTTKEKMFRAAHDYGALAEDVFAVMSPGGTAFFCTNHAKIHADAFRKAIGGAAHRAGRVLAQLKSIEPPRDFPPAPGEPAHLKTVVARLAPTDAPNARREEPDPRGNARKGTRSGATGKPGSAKTSRSSAGQSRDDRARAPGGRSRPAKRGAKRGRR